MNREELAEEIRAAGLLLRYADGPVLWGQSKSTKSAAKQSTRRKLKESDLVIVRRASTCFTCKKRASDADIREAEEMAVNYQSFARQIWLAIDHHDDCDAVPSIPVHEEAKKAFAKARKKFTKKTERKAEKAEKKARKAKQKKAADKKPRRARGE